MDVGKVQVLVQLFASSPRPWRKMMVAGEAGSGFGAGIMIGGALDIFTFSE